MKNFRRVALVFSAVSVGCGTLFAVASGCSSSSSTPLPDGGGDASPDGTVDGAPEGPGIDSQPDVRDSSSDGDAGSQGDVIISVDSGDASALYAFPGQLAAALCTKLQQCCAV